MRIAVIDDERPSRSELCHLLRELLPDAQLDEADSGQRALELASEERYDAAFVDVHLGDMTGTTLSLMLKKLLPEIQIVFATAYDEYAVKAFEMDAADYIMKPFDPKRVARAVQKLQTRLRDAAPPAKQEEIVPQLGKLSLPCEKRVVLLDIADIAYIETDSRCCVLHTSGGAYTSTQPLGYFEKKLAQARFFRIHKSYLINLQSVAEIFPWQGGTFGVKLRGYEREVLPVSRKQLKLFKEIFEF